MSFSIGRMADVDEVQAVREQRKETKEDQDQANKLARKQEMKALLSRYQAKVSQYDIEHAMMRIEKLTLYAVKTNEFIVKEASQVFDAHQRTCLLTSDQIQEKYGEIKPCKFKNMVRIKIMSKYNFIFSVLWRPLEDCRRQINR